MINAWYKRKATLPGKITLIESFMLAKFTHLFLALPNPPDDLITRGHEGPEALT